jgi:hypothetical protein
MTPPAPPSRTLHHSMASSKDAIRLPQESTGLFGFMASCSLTRILSQASFVQAKSMLVGLFGFGGLR